MRSKRVLVCGFVACLIASVVVVLGPGAQYTLAQTEKASISGRITDQSNAVMPDAEVELKMGSAVESVPVTAESGAGLVSVTGSELGTVITQEAIHELPLNGRNFT